MNTKKILILALAAVLLVAVSVGGTMAYMTAKTQKVENTFTTTSIAIELWESDLVENNGEYTLNEDEKVASNTDYLLLPGLTMPKDPYVEVTQGEVYVFVEVVASETPSAAKYIDWDIQDDWTALQGADGTGEEGPHGGVMYGYSGGEGYVVKSVSSANGKLYILEDNEITVFDTITSKDIADLTVDGTYTSPSLTFYAYAVQATENDDTGSDSVWAQYLRDATAN